MNFSNFRGIGSLPLSVNAEFLNNYHDYDYNDGGESGNNELLLNNWSPPRPYARPFGHRTTNRSSGGNRNATTISPWQGSVPPWQGTMASSISPWQTNGGQSNCHSQHDDRHIVSYRDQDGSRVAVAGPNDRNLEQTNSYYDGSGTYYQEQRNAQYDGSRMEYHYYSYRTARPDHYHNQGPGRQRTQEQIERRREARRRYRQRHRERLEQHRQEELRQRTQVREQVQDVQWVDKCLAEIISAYLNSCQNNNNDNKSSLDQVSPFKALLGGGGGLDDSDVQVTIRPLKVSFICPITRERMKHPCRPTQCTHLQCFDAAAFLKLNRYKAESKWKCPICSGPVTVTSLAIDRYQAQIMASATDSDLVAIHPDGTWSVAAADDGGRSSNNKEKKHVSECTNDNKIVSGTDQDKKGGVSLGTDKKTNVSGIYNDKNSESVIIVDEKKNASFTEDKKNVFGSSTTDENDASVIILN